MFPVAMLDTQAIQFTQHLCDRLIQRCFHRLAQAAARLEGFPFNSHQKHIGGRDSEQLGAEECIDQRWRVRIHAHGWSDAHDISFAVQQHCSRIRIRVDGIDENHGIIGGELIDQVESRGAQVDNFDALVELVVGGQKPRHIRPDSVIPEQDVPNPANEYSLHSIFTLAIWRPDASNVWQAQAMQGSKEWIVLNTSNGSSGRASGVCSSDAS